MPMLIAIQREKYYSISVPALWAEYLEAHGVEVRWVDLVDGDFLGHLEGCDGLMWHRGHKSQDKLESERILYSIEHYLGLPVFPPHNISWHYDEKLSQYYLLQAAGVPTPKTWVFWGEKKALEWAHETDYPKVFKLSAGAGGTNVAKVRNSKEATKLIHRMFGPGIYGGQIEPTPWWRHPKALARRWISASKYIISGELPKMPGSNWRLEKGHAYFQEFIPHEYETRIYVIGNRIWCGRRFAPPGDFRASLTTKGRDLIDRNPSGVDMRCVQMAVTLLQRLGFLSMKWDFLLRDGEPVVTEMDYVVGAGLAGRYPGTWNQNLKWEPGNKLHAEGQVDAFLERVKSTETEPTPDLRRISDGQF